jgi:hypothetical protein
MILQFGPDAPLLARLGADALLFLHIGGGTVGMASGAVAIVASKGRRLHAVAGTTFFVSMMTMTLVAAVVAPFVADPIGERWTNMIAAVFTCYLVLSAWMTVRRRDGGFGRAQAAAAIVPAMIALLGVGLGLVAARRPLPGLEPGLVLCGLAALAAICDLRVARRGILQGRDRLARHVWRMSLALFMAVGSFFLGQQKVLPEAMRGTLVQFAPVLAVVALGLFWFIRVRFPFHRRPSPVLS